MRFANTVPSFEAIKRADEIRKSAVLQEAMRNELEVAAKKKAPQMLLAARNYLTNGKPNSAAEQLRKIILDFPETSYSKDAQKLLDSLPTP